jgi:hypothetical protein
VRVDRRRIARLPDAVPFANTIESLRTMAIAIPGTFQSFMAFAAYASKSRRLIARRAAARRRTGDRQRYHAAQADVEGPFRVRASPDGATVRRRGRTLGTIVETALPTEQVAVWRVVACRDARA